MLHAKDIMIKDVITVEAETRITEAARLLLQHRINGIPVVDVENRVIGMICQSDLIAEQSRFPVPSFFTILDSIIPLRSHKDLEKDLQKITAVTVSDAMTRNPVTVDSKTSVEEIATIMVRDNIHTIPVTSRGKLVGIIGKEDILRTIISPKEAKRTKRTTSVSGS